MTPLDSALAYAERGWRVVPIPKGQKHPRIPAWQKAATTDPDLITEWWTKWPDDGIGIACGAESGIVVIDVDVSGDKVGMRTLADLEAKHGALPETFSVRTGSGGMHYYFAYDKARPVGNGKLGQDIDIKAEGGQVVAPPTLHPVTGRPYLLILDVPLAPFPEWCYELLAKPERVVPAPGPVASGGDGPAQRYNEAFTWDEILTADGWQIHHVDRDGEVHWTRPGKQVKGEQASATTNYKGRDCLMVFTTSVPGLDAHKAYSKFGYYAAMHHGGDRSAAARQLRAEGYGADPADFDPVDWMPDDVKGAAKVVVDASPPSGPGAPWLPPIPMGDDRGDLPEFPVDVFPSWFAEMCRDVAKRIQVPVDLPATIGMAVLSLATNNRVKLVYDDWVDTTNLYLVVAMPPGAGKSPVFKAMSRCVTRYENDLAKRMVIEVNEASSRHRSLESKLKKAEDKGDESEAALLVAELNSHEVPALPRLIVDDITVEALVRVLHEQKGRLGLLSTEGGLFEQMVGRYSKDNRANLDPYLQAWSGDPIRVDRIGRDNLIVDEPYLTIGLTVQPQVISNLSKRPELAGRGLTARFMYSVPADNVGHRDFTRRGVRANQAVIDRYEEHVTDMLRRMASFLTPGTLTLTDEAADLFAEFRQSIEDRRVPGGDLRPLAEWSVKLEASTLRLVGLLHLAHGRPAHGDIDGDMVTAALEVADYWIEHAFAVHDMWGTDEIMVQARMILDWLAKRGLDTFTGRDVYTAHRRQFPKAEMIEEPVRLLVERGWVRPLEPVEIVTGKRGKTLGFEVNPALFNPDELRALRALPEIGPKSADDENPAKTPKPADKVRAMRALCLDTDSGDLSMSPAESALERSNEVGCAHGAHGAQLDDDEVVDNSEPYDPYSATTQPGPPDLDGLF